MTKILSLVNGFVWGIPALVLIIGVGLYLSLSTGFAQLRLLPKAFRSFFTGKSADAVEQGSVSPFRALCTALAATVGTGNLAGVAGAIAIGGPGAVFWMWICGLLGMITKFAEAALAVRYRGRNSSGEFVGGPMHMIEKGMGSKWRFLASIYCFFGVIAAFGVGNATQINALIGSVNSALGVFGIQGSSKLDLVMGIALAVLIVFLLLGGAKRIGAAAERLIPFASCAYVALCIGVLILRSHAVVPALRLILVGAFSPRAATGGVLGSAFCALRLGVSRGVFTNEAGMGTASIAHASAHVTHPVEQGLMGILEVFIDTIVICTMTALVILCSGVEIPYGVDEGVLLTGRAFAVVYGGWVNIPLALFLCCFALATILGWGLYGARCAQYLFGVGAWKPFVFLQAVTAVVGVLLKTGTVWLLSETVNGLMVIPNLIVLAVLSPELNRLIKEYQTSPGGGTAIGGTYENFHQRKPLRTLSHAKVSSLRGRSRAAGKADLPPEHRSARPADP